jgi:NUMOD1 domain
LTNSLNVTKVPLPKNNSTKELIVEVYNSEGNLISKFDSINKASLALGLNRQLIRNYADKGKLCKGKYFF